MAAISVDTPRKYDPAIEPAFADIPVKSNTTIYEGAALSDDGGDGVADALAASEAFLGFADKYVSNPTGGSYRVRVRQRGIIKNLAVTGLNAATNLGAGVYATSSGDFTLTASGAVQIGKVVSYNGVSGYGDVYFEAAIVRSI